MMNCDNREEMLEFTIKEVIMELEKTKKSFRSKKIKEVRERMIQAIGR